MVNMAVDRGDFTVVAGASRYQVLWPHAKGGLGEVYLAEDTELHRRVALKEIQAKHAQDPVSRERFVAEAEITGNLEHPGVVPVYGLGTYHDGRPFYTMRFIKGEDLATAIRRFHSGPQPNFTGLEFRWLFRKLIDVCNTVAYAHSRGVLHRDLKPGNIMIGPFGETLVMDWGVAKLIGRTNGDVECRASTSTASGEPAIRLRIAERLRPRSPVRRWGRRAYMSPEQAAGELDALGPASDVYSLGATLYVMLTDRRPFQGGVKEVLQKGSGGPVSSLRGNSSRGYPSALDAICRRAMALEPSQRYESALSHGRRTSIAGWRTSRSPPGAIRGRIGRGDGCAATSRWWPAGRPRSASPSWLWRWPSLCSRSPGGTNGQRDETSIGNASWHSRKPAKPRPTRTRRTKKRTAPRRHSGFWSTRFAGPIRRWMAAP